MAPLVVLAIILRPEMKMLQVDLHDYFACCHVVET